VAKNKKSTPTKTSAPVKPGGLEFYFDKYAAAHQNSVNKVLQIIAIPLLMFSIFGLSWAIPFPYLKFLGKLNGDFNWASFIIAISIYFYFKLSPLLSYIVFFVELGFSYLIIELLQWQKVGGPELWQFCGLLLILSIALLFTGYKKEGKKLSFEYRYKNLLIAPLFLLHLVFRRFSIKY
jgi:uncharacterized membrane protein YGL010W